MRRSRASEGAGVLHSGLGREGASRAVGWGERQHPAQWAGERGSIPHSGLGRQGASCTVGWGREGASCTVGWGERERPAQWAGGDREHQRPSAEDVASPRGPLQPGLRLPPSSLLPGLCFSQNSTKGEQAWSWSKLFLAWALGAEHRARRPGMPRLTLRFEFLTLIG